MKRLLCVCLLLMGCAAKKTPEQLAEEQAAWDRWNQALAAVRISRNEPNNCTYIKAIDIAAYGKSFQSSVLGATYDEALQLLREESVKAGANMALIDNLGPPQVDGDKRYHIQGRLFNCP